MTPQVKDVCTALFVALCFGVFFYYGTVLFSL